MSLCSKYFCGALLFVILGQSLHGGDLEIAVVDMEILVKAHSDTDVAETVLKKQADEFEAERAAQIDALDALGKRFEALRQDAESGALSDLGREQKRLDAQEVVVKIREGEKSLNDTTTLRQNQLADRRKRMRQRIVEDVRGVINAYAKSRGIKLVMEKHARVGGADMVLFVDASIDVTEPLKRRVAEETAR
ncbi:MAG: Skp family chaperone for outer membrane protein [Candidatus Promineifilaceae bacterium]|jgi:Skp family chaperone for outer membrane proteins